MSDSFCDPMDCSLTFSVHGIFQTRILGWVAIFSSTGSSQPRDGTWVSHIVGRLVQFSRSVVSDSLRPHGLQHARLPCPSPTPRACSNSCPSSQWWHPTILSSIIPFSSCLQSFPVSGSFPMSQFFTAGGQSLEASASVLPMNIQDWFPLGLTVWTPYSPRDSQESSPAIQFKSINSSVLSHLYSSTLTFIYDYWKNHQFSSIT